MNTCSHKTLYKKFLCNNSEKNGNHFIYPIASRLKNVLFHTMKYYLIITRNEILMHVKPGDILNERRQSQNDYIIHNFTYLRSPEIA